MKNRSFPARLAPLALCLLATFAVLSLTGCSWIENEFTTLNRATPPWQQDGLDTTGTRP